MILKNTRAMFASFVDDVNKLIYVSTIIIQIFFLGFYGYSIYNNINNIYFLVIYSLLAVLSLFGFIFYLSTYNHRSDNAVKSTKNFLKVSKFGVNGFAVGIKIAEIIMFASGTIDVLLVAFSAILYVLQIILELIKRFVVKYVELFKTSVEMDFAPITNTIDNVVEGYKKIQNTFVGFGDKVKTKMLDVASAPIGFIAGKFDKVDEENVEEIKPLKIDKKQQKANKKLEKRKQFIAKESEEFEKDIKAKKEAKKEAEREIEKQKAQEKFAEKKNELKKQLGVIAKNLFKKENVENDNDSTDEKIG